ncbi:MAG: hypothetical protein RL071_2650 [Pseudomonadota bacterium]|jgi:hypothetical protein
MSQHFHAFVKKAKLPPTREVARALSSRGWRVEISTEATLDAAGSLTLKVDGSPVQVAVAVASASEPAWAALAAAAQTDAQGELWLGILKANDLRLTFTGDDPKAVEWARECARGVGLLAAGGFHNPQQGTLLQFGR